MPFMAFAMSYPDCVTLVCSAVFLGETVAEVLFLPPEVTTLLVGPEILVVLALLLFVMVCLVGLFFDDGS